MFQRLIFTVLTLVLFWSGDTGHEKALALASADHVAAALPDSGPLDEQQLDDQPSQSLAEAQFDPPGLTRDGHDVRVPVLAMAAPTPLSVADRRPPYLDAPQRPPSAASVS